MEPLRGPTHLRSQSCQVSSCQRDIPGNLGMRANERLVEKEDVPGNGCRTGECVPLTSAHYGHSRSLTLYQVLFPASITHPTQQLSDQIKNALTLHK